MAGGVALLVAAGVFFILFFLDPLLKRTLEKQVAQQTDEQYHLKVRYLKTHLFSGGIELHGLRLRPATTVADSLPRLRADLAHFTADGVGLWDVLWKNVVPIDSVGLDSLQLTVTRLPATQPKEPADTLALYEKLPLDLPGLRIGTLVLHNAQASVTDNKQPVASFERADVRARDLRLSAAGAADSQRLGYAANWQVRLRGAAGQAGTHRLKFQRADFATALQRLVVDSLRLRPLASAPAAAAKFRLDLPRLILSGWRAAAWQHLGRFYADSLALAGPNLTFWPPDKEPPPMWQLLAPLMRRADLGYFGVSHGEMRIGGADHKPEAHDINLVARAIRVDSVAGRNGSGRILYAQRWTGHSGRISATFSPPEYPASIEHTEFDTNERRVRLRTLALTPAFTPAQLNRRKGYQLATVRIRIPELDFEGVNFQALADYRSVYLQRLTVKSPDVTIRSDGRGPINPNTSDIRPEAVRKLKFELDVRRLDISDGTLHSYYRSPATPITGRLDFTRFNGSIFNFSNEPKNQSAQHPLTGRAVGYLADACRIELHLTAFLLDPQGRHRAYGTFGPTSLKVLNPMTGPTKEILFKSGRIKHIDFHFTANQQRITGGMTARYDNLKFQFRNYDDGKLEKSLWSRLKTGGVNLVIRDQNPRPGGRLVSGEMISRREPRFSVFSLWRQGVVSGLLNNAGVPKPLAKKLSESQDKGPLPPPQ